jgi:hypothetical protein
MQNLLFVVVYALTIVLLWWPLWSTRYVVDQEQLTIRSLCFKWIIPLTAIQSVSETDNSISSPALSLDRLKIEGLFQIHRFKIDPFKHTLFIAGKVTSRRRI